jgi:signal-transduction protein with cAMP-binding, CBS, and nucleotidyltransferase domain
MNISSLCDREVIGIAAGASLHEAAALMCDEHVGSLVVVTDTEPPQVVGILTDRDMALEVLGRTGSADDLRAGHLAKAPPVAVLSTTGLQEAAAAMEQAGVRRLLVVEEDGGVIGIVAAEDLLAAISEELSSLVRALRSGIRREAAERKVMSGVPAGRPVLAGPGTVAVQ